MRKVSFRKACCVAFALSFSVTAFAQESKTKIEHGDYELKVKQEKDEFKLKEKGMAPARYRDQPETHTNSRTTTELRQGETITTVKSGQLPVTKQSDVTAQAGKKTTAKKSYASRKKSCTCKSVASRKPMKRKAVAYKPKTKTTTSRSVAGTAKTSVSTPPVIVRDTVMITRVDTVYSVMEQQVFTGYRQNTIPVTSDLKQMKIEREDDELKLKVEYMDGSEVKKTFSSDEDLNLYFESDMDKRNRESEEY